MLERWGHNSLYAAYLWNLSQSAELGTMVFLFQMPDSKLNCHL